MLFKPICLLIVHVTTRQMSSKQAIFRNVTTISNFTLPTVNFVPGLEHKHGNKAHAKHSSTKNKLTCLLNTIHKKTCLFQSAAGGCLYVRHGSVLTLKMAFFIEFKLNAQAFIISTWSPKGSEMSCIGYCSPFETLANALLLL